MSDIAHNARVELEENPEGFFWLRLSVLAANDGTYGIKIHLEQSDGIALRNAIRTVNRMIETSYSQQKE